MKSHLLSYPCPLQINSFWNLGFLLGITIILQIITGILLGLYYSSDLYSAYFSIFFIIREIYFGWSLRYFHSSGASFIFLFIIIHLSRNLFYSSYFYNPNVWFSGIFILLFLMSISFMGYVLPFGQMSFWGATVITNLLSPFPNIIELIYGGYYLYNPTLKRFFLFHFILPFLVIAFIFIHILYLHYHSSNNILRNTINNKIPFFPYIISKDLLFYIFYMSIILFQNNFLIFIFSHPDNASEVSTLFTPLHIVPEWYFLCQYAMLKAVPNKNSGFIILLTSIFIFFLFGEIRALTTLLLSISSLSLKLPSFIFSLLFIVFLYVGAQNPQDNFLSHGRILTLYYYFLLIYILFTPYFYSLSWDHILLLKLSTSILFSCQKLIK